METDPFWTLIADCRRRGLSGVRRDAWLRDALLRLTPPDLIAFQASLDLAVDRARTWDLWAAADRIFGGWCSDDTFCWFRRWLVGLGRPIFEAVVADADVLAYAPEVLRLSARPRAAWPPDAWPQWECLDQLAPEAYERLGGASDDGDSFHVAVRDLPARTGRRSGDRPARTPTGDRWSVLDEPESARRLPRLTAMFPLDTAEAAGSAARADGSDRAGGTGVGEEPASGASGPSGPPGPSDLSSGPPGAAVKRR